MSSRWRVLMGRIWRWLNPRDDVQEKSDAADASRHADSFDRRIDRILRAIRDRE